MWGCRPRNRGKDMRVVTVLLFVLSAVAHAAPTRGEYVTRIIDGDTVELSGGERLRLVGVQTPERGEVRYYKAGLYLAHLTLRREIRVVRFGQDRYKRTLAVLWLNDRQVNATMRKRYKSKQYDKLLTKEMRVELVKGGWK